MTPKFTAIIREGADELTLRAEEEGVRYTFIDTTNVEDQQWGPPLVDADWHAFGQAMYQGIEGQEWEATYHHHKELHQAVRTKKPGDNQKAKALWAVKAAKKTEKKNCMAQFIKTNSRKNPNPPLVVGRAPEKSSGCSGEGAGMLGM